MRAPTIIPAMILASGGSLFGQVGQRESRIRLMTFGDVNLGRTVGQDLLKGDLDFPFKLVKDTLAKADFVFANLEGPLSEQGGKTQDPKHNVVFCGPPVGAEALKRGKFSMVSTANNHAFDYGIRALRETILNLRGVGIPFVGTSLDSVDGCEPVIVEKAGIRIGFLAYTQFVNIGGAWRGTIALYDAQQARRDLDSLRPKVDFIVVSYHGGEEYKETPSEKVRRDFRMLADEGADVVVGHHPHCVQGIEIYNGKLLFYSLGNFVFYQPQFEWARFGLGVDVSVARNGRTVGIEQVRLLPLRAGLQPAFRLTAGEKQMYFSRLKKMSRAHGEVEAEAHRHDA